MPLFSPSSTVAGEGAQSPGASGRPPRGSSRKDFLNSSLCSMPPRLEGMMLSTCFFFSFSSRPCSPFTVSQLDISVVLWETNMNPILILTWRRARWTVGWWEVPRSTTSCGSSNQDELEKNKDKSTLAPNLIFSKETERWLLRPAQPQTSDSG
jgi:hypothetical protein